ncbi:MAG: hypothetical protein AB8I08_36660 [Sandaracinaceae bacterium]
MTEGRPNPLRRDAPIYVLVAAVLLVALFWPPAGVVSRSIEMDETAVPDLVSGWGEPERSGRLTFMWAVDHEAAVRLQVEAPRDRVVSVRCWPIALPDGTQDMAVLLNGTLLTSFELDNRARIYSATAPSSAFRPAGEQNVLEFYLGHLHRPPGDPRSLAVAFDWIRVVDLE